MASPIKASIAPAHAPGYGRYSRSGRRRRRTARRPAMQQVPVLTAFSGPARRQREDVNRLVLVMTTVRVIPLHQIRDGDECRVAQPAQAFDGAITDFALLRSR